MFKFTPLAKYLDYIHKSYQETEYTYKNNKTYSHRLYIISFRRFTFFYSNFLILNPKFNFLQRCILIIIESIKNNNKMLISKMIFKSKIKFLLRFQNL